MVKNIKTVLVTVVSTTEVDEDNNPVVLKSYTRNRKPKVSNEAKKIIDDLGHMNFTIDVKSVEEKREMSLDTYIKYSTLVEDVTEA